MKPDSSIIKLFDISIEVDAEDADEPHKFNKLTGTKGSSPSFSQLDCLQSVIIFSASNNLQRNKKSNGDGWSLFPPFLRTYKKIHIF